MTYLYKQDREDPEFVFRVDTEKVGLGPFSDHAVFSYKTGKWEQNKYSLDAFFKPGGSYSIISEEKAREILPPEAFKIY